MQVNDKNMIYEISKQLPRPTQRDTEQIGDKTRVVENNVTGSDSAGQDAIVDFSPELKDAETIRKIIASEPDVREEKVAELKTKIETGEYRIDHGTVADKLVDSFLDESF